jgi:signal transduction histidine kinase
MPCCRCGGYSEVLVRKLEEKTLKLDDCIAIADGALAQIRSLALELRPPQLDQLGLTAALRDLTERMAATAGLEAHFLADMHEVTSGDAQSTSAFRVAQEAVTNVVRHSGASQLTVELRRHKCGPQGAPAWGCSACRHA